MRVAALGLPLLLLLGTLAAAAPARAQPAEWTILVYMGGDNNLEDVGILDFLEMAAVGSTPEVNVLVQFDRAVGYDASHGDWTTVKRYRILPGMLPNPVLALSDLGELNMGDPATLVDFVRWGTTNYPARHYLLDLWDHGLGWKGVILDGGDYITTQELGSALASIEADLGRNLDVVGGDACRLTLEVMYELQPHVDLFVGSQKDVPIDGWPYDDVLAPLVADPTMTPLAFGDWIARAYVDSYRGSSAYSVTLSVVSSPALPDVIRTFRDVVAELNASVPLLQAEVIQARTVTERYERAGGGGQGDEFDLFHFAENVIANVSNPRLGRLAERMNGAIRAAVLVNEVWDNPNPINGVHARNAHGFSIWFPDVPTEIAYPPLALSRDTDWDDFLAAYRSGTPSPVPSNAAATSVDASLPTDGTLDRIDVDVAPTANGTIEVDLYLGSEFVDARVLPGVEGRPEAVNFSPAAPGFYTVSVLFSIAGELADAVVVPGLRIQVAYAFTGTVTDPAGRPVLGATVTLTNPRTGIVRTTTSTASGFRFDVLVPDFFVDGDVLVLAASAGGRVSSASFAASVRGTSQTANLVLDPSGTTSADPALVAGAAVLAGISAVLGAVVLLQRRAIRDLRRRPPFS